VLLDLEEILVGKLEEMDGGMTGEAEEGSVIGEDEGEFDLGGSTKGGKEGVR